MKFYLKLEEARRIALAIACCQSNEETRYYLNGVFIENGTDGLLAVATDGHRLGKLQLVPVDIAGDQCKVAERFSYIIPREAVTWLAKLPGKCSGSDLVSFDADEKRITLEHVPAGMVGVFNLVDGNFPDWRRVVPAESPATIGFNSAYLAELGNAVKRSSDHRGARLTLHVSDANGPAYITTGNPALAYVLMPMRM